MIFKLIYLNFLSIKFNENYKYLINKNVIVDDNFYKDNYKFIGFYYIKNLGIKINLIFLLKKSNKIYLKDFESINKIYTNKIYYYDFMFKILNKYNSYFKNTDLYILNNIKEFLY